MITLTEAAAQKVTEALAKRGQGLGIRVGVRTTGCSGLAYVLEYVDQDPNDDNCLAYESQGVKVWTDAKSLPYIQGIVMDWQKQGLNEGFEFANPNERSRCGCGESFSV